MRQFRTILVLGFSAAFAVLPLSPPPFIPEITLKCSLQSADGRRVHLQLHGTAAVPDGTILALRLRRLQEVHRRGRIEADTLPYAEASVEVKDGRFSHQERGVQHGFYHVTIDFPPCRLEIAAWDGDFLDRLMAERKTIEAFLRDLGTTTNLIRSSTATQARWDRYGMEVLYDILRLQDRVAKNPHSRRLFPAALENVSTAANRITSASPHFFWTDDQGFAGAFDPSTGSWVMGPDGRPFSFDGMASFLEATVDLLRREHSLWIIKDAHRVLQVDRLDLHSTRAIRNRMKATLDRIEAGIRGKPRTEPAVEPAPIPDQFVAIVARHRKAREARAILQQADRRWEELGDQTAPSLYRQLLRNYPDEVESLKARVRVVHRARSE